MSTNNISSEQLLILMYKNLQLEMHAIMFYLKNLHQINYTENKPEVDMLILDSVTHLKLIIQEILVLYKKTKETLSPGIIEEASREESGMKELYLYLANKVEDGQLKDALIKLSKMEEGHERLLKGFK